MNNIKRIKDYGLLLLVHLLLCGFADWMDVPDQVNSEWLKKIRSLDEEKLKEELINNVYDQANTLSKIYFYKDKDKRNYHEGMYWQQVTFNTIDMPTYTWSTQRAKNNRWVYNHNGKFNAYVYALEDKMLSYLAKYDSEGLFNHLILSVKRDEYHTKMLNGNGTASKEYCQLTTSNQMLYLVNELPPNNNRVVVDV